MTTVAMTCAWCGEALTDEESESPDRSEAGEIICGECWSDEYTDICTRCGDRRWLSELASQPGSLIAMWSDDEGMRQGYYRVTRWPFFADGMIEGFFFEDQLEFLGNLDPAGKRAAEYASSIAGPLCAECQRQVERTLSVPAPTPAR